MNAYICRKSNDDGCELYMHETPATKEQIDGQKDIQIDALKCFLGSRIDRWIDRQIDR